MGKDFSNVKANEDTAKLTHPFLVAIKTSEKCLSKSKFNLKAT